MSIVEDIERAHKNMAMNHGKITLPSFYVSPSQMELICLEIEWAKLPRHQAHMRRLKYFLKKKLTRKRKLLPLPQ